TYIDAVARGAFHFADDRPLALSETIDEGALAGVAFADDRELQSRVRLRRFVRGLGGKMEFNRFEKLCLAAVLLSADAQHVAEAELVEFADLAVEFGCVALIGRQDHRLADAAQP